MSFQVLAERGEADPSASGVPPDDRLRVHVAADHLHVRLRSSGRQHGRAGQVSRLRLHLTGEHCHQCPCRRGLTLPLSNHSLPVSISSNSAL